MAIRGVRDVVTEGVAQHPPAVVLIDAILLAEHGEGMAAVVRRVPRQAKLLQGGVHPGAEAGGAAPQQVPAAVMAPGHEWEDGRVDGHGAPLPGLRLHAAREAALPKVYPDVRVRLDAEAAVAHDQEHLHNGVFPVRPERPQLAFREGLPRLVVIRLGDVEEGGVVLPGNLILQGILVHLVQQADDQLQGRVLQRAFVEDVLQVFIAELPELHAVDGGAVLEGCPGGAHGGLGQLPGGIMELLLEIPVIDLREGGAAVNECPVVYQDLPFLLHVVGRQDLIALFPGHRVGQRLGGDGTLEGVFCHGRVHAVRAAPPLTQVLDAAEAIGQLHPFLMPSCHDWPSFPFLGIKMAASSIFGKYGQKCLQAAPWECYNVRC